MQVELRIRGMAGRLASSLFDDYEVCIDGSETVVRGPARDDAEALALIDMARSVGLTVVAWRLIDSPVEEDPTTAPAK